ncbi:DUF2934 domain-containing protein [Nitrospira sp. CMX1]|nr:DUF2934 domain-containing protein [Nitrospira sp.]MBS0165139.1 DUF2934 domain-containing protein [Nitrospira sp.]
MMKSQPTKQGAKKEPVIQQVSRIQASSPTERAIPKKDSVFDDVHVRITARAYQLYVERGCREGYAEQDWLDAESEILNRTFQA